MEDIIYEKETVKEVVFEGDYILDRAISEEGQRQAIFQMMRDAHIPVYDEDEYEIGYDGVEDDNGISETQTSHFVVTRTYQKQVPYKLVRDEVFRGEWVLDGLGMTPAEQRKKIFGKMRTAGIKVENEDEYEIGYEGVSDNEGISETQTTQFVVYHLRRERLQEGEDTFHLDESLPSEEKLRIIYEELKALRDKVHGTNNTDELSRLSIRMGEISDALDQLVDTSTRDYSPFERAFSEVEEQIRSVQEEILANMQVYSESYERIKSLVGEQADLVSTATNPEEFEARIREIMKEKYAENAESLSIREVIDRQLEDIKKLTKKRDKIHKDFIAAQALGLSAAEYRELTDNFRSRNLVNAILEKKGLGEILAVPAKDRTPEQKRRIKAIRKEVFTEIAKVKKENEEKSVLKVVEALYGIETEVKLKGKQRVLVVRPHSLDSIRDAASKMPEKIPGKEAVNPNYQPGEVPEDMVAVLEKRAEDEKRQLEKTMQRLDTLERYILYRDPDQPGKLFAKESFFARFNLEEIGDPISIEGEDAYEISLADVDEVLKEAYNEEDPYIIEIHTLPSRERETVSEETTPVDDMGSIKERITVFEDKDQKYYVRKPIIKRFDLDPLSSEVRIEGTACYQVSDQSVEAIDANANNDYSPYFVEHKFAPVVVVRDSKQVPPKEVQEEAFHARGLRDQLTVFMDDQGKYYIRKPAFERFNVFPANQEEVRLDGTAGYEVSYSDIETIVTNQNNELSPYDVIFRKTTVVRTLEEVITPPVVADSMESRGSIEQFIIFLDENGKYYARKPVFERFNAIPVNDTEVRLDGVAGYEIAIEDLEKMERLKNDSTSPYQIIYKKVTLGRTPEEVVTPPVVEDAMESRGSTEQFTVFLDENGKYYVRKPVFERFNAFPVSQEEVRLDGVAGYEIAIDDLEKMERLKNDSTSPYQIIYKKVNLGRTPEVEKPVSEDVMTTEEVVTPPVVEEEREQKNIREQLTVFLDENGKYYVRKPAFERFNAFPVSQEEVRLDGVAGYEIAKEDVQRIVDDRNNETSPYRVIYKKVNLGRTPEVEKPAPEEVMTSEETITPPVVEEETVEYIPGTNIPKPRTRGIYETDEEYVEYLKNYYEERFGLKGDNVISPEPEAKSDSGTKEQFTIFLGDNGKYYARKPVFERFNAIPVNDVEVRLDGVAGYEIAVEDLEKMERLKNDSTSPYNIIYKKIPMGQMVDEKSAPEPKKVTTNPPVAEEEDLPVTEDTVEEKEEKKPKRTKKETITLYRDVNDNNQVYAPDSVLSNFGIKALAEPTMIEGVPCHKISRDTDQIINSIAKMSKNPKIVVQYVDVQVKEISQETPRPHVEDILDKVTTGLEIHAQDSKHYRASNLHVAKEFADELHSGNYAYNIVHIVPATLKAGVGFFRKLSGALLTTTRAKDAMRMIEERLANLSEEELDVLFEEYKGTQLKTDMNNQINPLILDRLRQFGLDRVAVLNDRIQKDYASLFTLLGQIKALEEKIKEEEKGSSSLENERQALMKKAAVHVREIIENRKKANNILSSGVHGLEEDFKAVATKLSYVGMRFAKTSDFDNDLQHKLGQFGRKLNTALANGDDEEIVQNFMGLETCYYENTEIRGSVAGKRSVGSKYYSPVAEQFDYRDDPFIRDLFTTVAVTSAAVSAINAIRVHQIESQQILEEQQKTMDQVHEAGDAIASKSGTFQEGMEAQAEQDILTNATVRERAHLDSTNWKFNDAYHAADAAGHAAYNQFNLDVTSQINAVTSQYAQGFITQAQALERMAQISSDAQATLRDVVESSLNILRPYAASHPQFDLSAVEQSMQYVVAHPNAIADMNQAMVDVTNIAGELQNLSASPMSALGYLPSDMASTLVCAASAALLASNVSSTMCRAGQKKGTYGNEVTQMMDEYLAHQEGQVEEEEKQAQR
ncbi:MAG: hypothetical protein J6X28_04125 [Bacilli bacterium]|nr:hypothetical protein [Bacilli bacterium]